ncbi:hypothetical protein MMC27_002463 [Xylographa pallens]|nr:hypothetical protein [Xylographa pallens]
MLAMSTTTVFASPLAQLTTDPLGTFLQSTISSAQQQAQAHPGSSQVSVCNNGVCTHSPSALTPPITGPPAPAGNNAANGANAGISSLTVNTGNGQTVQGADMSTPPLAAGVPGPKPRKNPKKAEPKTLGGSKKSPKRRQVLLPGMADPLALATAAKAQGAAIDQAVAQQEAGPSAAPVSTTNGQAATGPDQVAPPPPNSPPDTGAPTPSDPTTTKKKKQQKQKHPQSPGAQKHKRPTTAHHAMKPLRRRFLDGATSAAQALAIADGLTGDSAAPAPAPAPAQAPVAGGWPSTDSSTVVNTGGQNAQGPDQVAPPPSPPPGASGGSAGGKGKPKKGGKKPGKKGRKMKPTVGVGMPKAGGAKMPAHVRRGLAAWLSEAGY